MSMSVLSPDRIPLSQKERDVLKIMHAVLRGERTQAEAAPLLDKSTPSPTHPTTTPSRRHRRPRPPTPVHPGQRGGRVVIEQRLEGSLAIRFRDKYLSYREVPAGCRAGGSAPRPPEFSALAADARVEEKGPPPE